MTAVGHIPEAPDGQGRRSDIRQAAPGINAVTRSRWPAKPLVNLAFWLPAFMLLLNIVHIPELTGVGRVLNWSFAVPILLSQLFLASLVFRVPLRWTLGAPGFLIVATMASCLVIGSAMVIGKAPYPYEYLLKYGYFIVTIVATAVGGAIVLRQTGVEGLAQGVLMLLCVTCILIITSPVLADFFPHAHHNAYFRFTGTFGDPNDAGYAACLTVALALALLAPQSRCRRLAGAVLIIGVAAVFLSQSRTSALALVLVFLFFLLSTHRSLKKSFLVWLTTIGATAIVAFAVTAPDRVPGLSDEQLRRLSSLKDTPLITGNISAGNNRPYLWQTGLSRIAESPVLGNGLGEFQQITDSGCSEGKVDPCGVHNIYLLLLGEAGMVPLAFFLLFLGSLLWQRLRQGPSIATDVAAGWTLIFAVHAMTFHHLLDSMRYGFVIGLSCAMAAYANEYRHAKNPR